MNILKVIRYFSKAPIKNIMEPQQPLPTTIHQQQTIDESAGEKVFQTIKDYLTQKQVHFDVLEHESAKTAKESAEMRNTPLEWGSKTMLVRSSKDKQVYMLLYRANHKISWSKLRKVEVLGKKARMCEEAELTALGVKPGAVPPFAGLMGLKGVMDCKFKEEKMMAFNAGLRRKSMVMSTKDFLMEEFDEFDITE